MKAFSIATVLTGVTIILCSSLSLGAEDRTFKDRDECAGYKAKEIIKRLCVEKTDETQKASCRANAQSDAQDDLECLALPTRADDKELKQTCDQAVDKYSEAATKEKLACGAFNTANKGNKKSCKAKAEECEKTINSLTNLSSFESDSGGYEFLDDALDAYATIDRIKNPTSTQQQTTSIAGAGAVCVKSFDSKARTQEKKDKTSEKQRLSDKIETLKNGIAGYAEDLNKKRAENKKSTNTIEKEAKTASLDRQKSTNQQISDSSKQLLGLESSIKKRKQDIAEKMRTLAQVNFEFQSQMLDLTDDEIKNACKQEFEAYKAALLSGGNIAGASEQDRAKVAALADQYKKKGILGSGEMKRLLITTRKKCYTQMNQKKRRTQLTNAQAVQKIQEGIETEKEQMLADKKTIETTQKELATAQQQLKDEGNAADAAKAAELDALSQELQADIENTELKINISKEKIQELTAEINNLFLVENVEVEDAYSEATTAIAAGVNARARAKEACNCDANPSTQVCKNLGIDQEKYDGEKPKKGKTKTSN